MLPFLLAQVLTLSGPLGDWATEIGRLTGSPVVILGLQNGEPPNAEPHRRLITRYFTNPSFVEMFSAAQAMSINPKDPVVKFQYVLINNQLAPRDIAGVDGLVAHELGHLWIKAQGFSTAQFVPGKTACLSVITGDVVQHIVMRNELDRRQIQWRPAWIRGIEPALTQLEKDVDRTGDKVPVCQKLAQILLWVDIELGISSKDWPKRTRLLELMAIRFPEVASIAEPLCDGLRNAQLLNKQVHRAALVSVFGVLKQFAISQQE